MKMLLEMIRHLKNNYPEYLIGYSDHTLPDKNMLPLVTAYLSGAVIIEKHFTFDKAYLAMIIIMPWTRMT